MSAETLEQQRAIGFEMFVSRVFQEDMFVGVTGPELRKRRVRSALAYHQAAGKVLDDLQGWETWACRFERIYGEAL